MVYIASNINSNIRKLEGALIRVVAFSTLVSQEISVELAVDALKDIILSCPPQVVTIPKIQQYVAEYYGLRPEVLKERKRTKAVAIPRQVAMYLSRELTDSSLPKIGEVFGGRDHTTIIHAHDNNNEVNSSGSGTY